jgi:hypothetical protein
LRRATLVLAIAAHAALVAPLFVTAHPPVTRLFSDGVHRVGPGADFFGLYHAALRMQSGGDPYDDAPDAVTPYFYPFRYLPIVAQAARALLVLSPNAARLAWMAVVEALLALTVLVFARRVPGERTRAFVVCALLLSTPYVLELHMGQFTFATVALAALGLLTAAGAPAFAAGSLLKLVPLAAVPALLRERRFLPHATLAVLACVVLSWPWFAAHPSGWTTFVHINSHTPGGHDSGNFAPAQLAWRLATDLHLALVTAHWARFLLVLRVLVLGLTAAIVLGSRESRAIPGAATLMLAHFASYGHVWEHQMSGVIVLGALLLVAGAEAPWLRALVIAAMVALVLPSPFPWLDRAADPAVWDPSLAWPRWQGHLLLLSRALPTLVLYAAGLAGLVRAGWRGPGGRSGSAAPA